MPNDDDKGSLSKARINKYTIFFLKSKIFFVAVLYSIFAKLISTALPTKYKV
jgi:hypothetical protein